MDDIGVLIGAIIYFKFLPDVFLVFLYTYNKGFDSLWYRFCDGFAYMI